MNSRERVLLALNHKEADRVPLDLGGTVVTGISVKAYLSLRRYLGLPEITPTFVDIIQQIATVDDDVVNKLGVDVKNNIQGDVPVANIVAMWETVQEYGSYGRMPHEKHPGAQSTANIRDPVKTLEERQ